MKPQRMSDLEEGFRRTVIVREARLRAARGMKLRENARHAGVSAATLWRLLDRAGGRAEPTAAELAPSYANCGGKPKLTLNNEELAAARAALLLTNRTSTSGSMPEALRLCAREGAFRPEIVSALEARVAGGRSLLTPSLRNALRIDAITTQAFRNPRNAWLNFVSSPGSLMLTTDEETGEERFVQPGEIWTLDDATINFVCCVPMERPGDKCWDKWGVIVGRFQFLLLADHRSYYLPGFSYTARPRDSYRAEDLVATLQTAFREHGYPKEMRLERGISASTVIDQMLGRLGVRVQHVASPHQKVVEFIFSKLWTALSSMPGQVGRFRGEEAEGNALLESCRRGARDPREYFPMLATVIAALRDVIATHNATPVNSARYGRRVPNEFWSRESGKHLRRLNASDAWMFSPVVSPPRVVKGFNVGTSVALMPGYSQKFTFSSAALAEYHGRRVKLWFNPFAPECVATLVLAEDVPGHAAGEVIGQAEMIDRQARYSRRLFGYGDDPDIGLRATRANAQSLRRHVQAIRPDGRPGVQVIEARDGEGHAASVQRGGSEAAEPVIARPRSAFAPSTAEEFARKRARLAASAAAARQLREMAET